MKKKLPLFFWPFAILFLLAVAVRIAARISTAFADAFNESVGAFFRAALAKMTGFLPFSLAELLILLTPLLLVALIFFGVRSLKKRHAFRRYVAVTLSILFSFYTLFVFTYAVGYQTTPIAQRMNLPDVKTTKERLYDVSLWASREADKLCPELSAGDYGTEMPYSWEEMTEHLNDAYETLSEKYPFLQSHRTSLKRIMLSEPMTYTGIVGVYSFFTGESNINTTYPDYCTVFTAAHEMAHQRGVAQEDAANFLAFLACIHASDAYIRYCGYLNLLDYTAAALSRTDKELYVSLYKTYSERTLAEKRAAAECYEAHQNDAVRDVASSVNDGYLQSQGAVGTIAYGLVVNLAVDYYETVVKKD